MGGVIPFNCPTNTALPSYGRSRQESWAKTLQAQQKLGSMKQRQPRSSGQNPARSSYTQYSVTGHLYHALLSCPALQGLLLWCTPWYDSGACLRVGCWVLQQESSLGMSQLWSTEQLWAALHLSNGARLSTSVSPCMDLTHTPAPPISQIPGIPACAKCSHCYPCFSSHQSFLG